MEVTMGRGSGSLNEDDQVISDNEWMNKLIDRLSLSENGSPYVLLSAEQGLPTEGQEEALVDEEITAPEDDIPQQRESLINPQSSSTEQVRKLLERFVDLEQPVITDKMSQFIMDPDTCRRLIGFISRLRETPRAAGEGRDISNLDSVRRSYRTMKVLVRKTPAVDNFIAVRLKEILLELFNVLDERSDGLVLHFTHTFENLIRRDPPAVLETLLADNGALLQKLVDYCYLDGVAEVTSQVIRANMNENTQRRRLLDALRTKGLIRALLQRCADRDPDISSNACENLDRICEAMFGDVAMPHLVFDPAILKEATSLLTQTFCSTESTAQQKFDSIKALQSSYMHWRRITKQGAPDAHYPDTFREALLANLPALCDGVIDISSRRVMQHKVVLNAYSVANSLSLLRLTAVRLVYLVLTHGDCQDADPKQLETIPASFWKLLTTLFLTHEHSSIFHTLFYRMFDMVMKSGSEATIKNLLGKPKFITKMLELYEADHFHSSRGYILLLCNYLHIMAQAHPSSSYLNNLLSQNQKWLEFLPQLEERTKRNYLGTAYEKGLLLAQRPELHMGPRLVRGEGGSTPTTPVQSMHSLAYTQPPPAYSGITSPGPEDGGFSAAFKVHVGLNNLKLAQESEPDLSQMDVEELARNLEGLSMGSEGNAGKKKKKKKKKKAVPGGESSSSPGHSGDEEEVVIKASDPLVH